MTPNHIWSQAEIDQRLQNPWQHKPKCLTDRIVHGLTWGLYNSFNALTGCTAERTTIKSVEWRLIVLESVAGVPSFIAAMLRHFRSLRTLRRDGGWIHTLLQEADNERMHLLVCMNVFKAGWGTRLLVTAAQLLTAPFLASLYVLKPAAVHRLVGYLQETACLTYSNIIGQVETPGTPLHEAWSRVPAPQMAITYWRLSPGVMWVDTLKCMFADKCNHRDVNHTFASMAADDPNPFVAKHQADAVHAWQLDERDGRADVGCRRLLHKTSACER